MPRGTLIRNAETGRIMADMSTDEDVVIAKGGRGGWGNTHFASPTRQTPRFAKPGTPGEAFELQLELKLLADVGLVGFPNVGKSTLVSVVSEAKPNIANYHFTTITPVLGVVHMPNAPSFVMADIPGLIEGAWQGVGLGHQFLRHVERCRMLIHIVDVSGSEGRDPKEDFRIINEELRKFNPDLANRPMLVAGNKCDLTTDEQVEDFRKFVEEQGYEFFPIMAAIRYDVDPLLNKTAEMLSTLPPVAHFEPEPEPEEPAAEVFAFREDVPLSAELQEVLWDACQEHKVEYALALGLIETESSFNTEAVSYVGCYGLMQLNPDYFPADLSPAENIQYGVAFIAEKLDQYAGNVGAALTAYNAGHDTGNREYAEKVMEAAERWREE